MPPAALVIEDPFHAKVSEGPYRHRDLLRRIAFVVVHAPLHAGQRPAGRSADDQPSGVAADSAGREVRYVLVGDLVASLEVLAEASESAAEDHQVLRERLLAKTRGDRLGCDLMLHGVWSPAFVGQRL
jgi:hypothetical protein